MKLKTKMLSCLCMFAVALTSLIVGVWALKTVDFTVGGNLSYIAPGIEATISKGTLANGTWVTASDADTKMPLTQITRQDTTSTLATKFSYWQDLNLAFNEAGDDTTITFSITNDMTKYGLAISVTTSYTSADNATIAINNSSVTLDPDASQEFVITLAVTDKTADASLSGFSIIFNMEMKALVVTPAEDVSYLTFTYNDTTMEATLKDCDTSVTSVEVPSRILYNEKTYKVTSMYSHSSASGGVFYGCNSLSSVVLPDTITNIGEYAFWKCTGLTSITIPDSVTSIGNYAFHYCTSLTSITIPDSVTSIGSSAFSSCTGLKSITIPDSVTSIGNYAFQTCTGLTSITIPDSVTSIGNYAFASCTSLTSITIPDSVTSIGNYAFAGCTSLTSITIPDSVTSIGNYAFEGCTSLTSVAIGSGVTSIGNYAFNGCTGLESVTIGSGVTIIGQYAFFGCTSLATVEVKATTVPTGGSSMFYNCPLTTGILVPSASVSAYRSATYWSTYSGKIKAGSF